MEVYEQMVSLIYESTYYKAQLCLVRGSYASLKKDCFKFLHPNEHRYLSTLKYEKRQHSYLLGRYSSKFALASYCNIGDFTQIHIESGIFQQPIAYYPASDRIQVSLSHCEDLGATIAFPETCPMGIDVERVYLEKISVIKDYLTLEESKLTYSIFMKLDYAYTMLWSIKEALSKVLKTGLTLDFKILSINSIQRKGLSYISEFKEFPQYQALSFNINDLIISIVYPKQIKMFLEVKNIRQWIQDFS